MAFKHTNVTLGHEPSVEDVHIDKLPRIAFAEQGDPKLVSTWLYPHHFVYRPQNIGAEGRYIDGVLVVHQKLLVNALVGAKRDRHAAAIKHVQAHRANIVPDPLDPPERHRE